MLYSAYSVILGGDCKLSDKGFTEDVYKRQSLIFYDILLALSCTSL